jgi:hypothetical protein
MAKRNKLVAAAMLAEVADDYITKAEDGDKKDVEDKER